MNSNHPLLGNLQSPLTVASGKWSWTNENWQQLAQAGAGAIATKSFWNYEHKGNDEPVVVQTEHWTLNAVGLPDFGPVHHEPELKKYLTTTQDKPPLIISTLGIDAADYAKNAARLAKFKPAALEINLSSPTFLKLRGAFFSSNDASDVISAVKSAVPHIPIFAKLTPNTANIGELAQACVEAGANGITAINTVGPGMAINLETRKPILSAARGGLSGLAIKPIAVRCITDIYQATEGKTPIIGTGGGATGEDAIELIMAGASLVGLGTIILKEGPSAITRINQEIDTWCNAHAVKDLNEIIGCLE